jgi:hypothetical protein
MDRTEKNSDPVAIEVSVLPDDNVTKVKPDAQRQGVDARGEMILDFDRTSHGGQGTRELSERAITRYLDEPPFVASEAMLNHFSLEPLELGIGSFLSALHQRGVADHVSG